MLYNGECIKQSTYQMEVVKCVMSSVYYTKQVPCSIA